MLNRRTNGLGVAAVLGDPLHGRRVWLRPVGPRDTEALRAIETGGALGPRWRFRGEVPSPEAYHASLWSDVLAQFLVGPIDTDQPLGVVCAYAADHAHGHASFAAAAFPSSDTSLRFLEGLALFIDYLFAQWPFRKLYAEVMDFNRAQFGSALARLLVVEGTLREHEFYNGRYWDKYFLALYRSTWETEGAPFVRMARGIAGDPSRLRGS